MMSASAWNDDSDVVDRIKLPPDPGLIKSLGASHTLESAVADLIDNSLDAEARLVRIRFITARARLRAIEVLDDGRGMDSVAINAAMTIGRQREYTEGSLGNFGLGLKAAGLGIGRRLTVWSHADGVRPVGRRLEKVRVASDFECEVLSDESAARQETIREATVGGHTGTMVTIDQVISYEGGSTDEASTWLHHEMTRLGQHLGVVFHRWISSERVRIEIEYYDIESSGGGIPSPVSAIDPFGYRATGRQGYPKTLIAKSGAGDVSLRCHIWPPRTNLAGFRLTGRDAESLQGFYVYRADRLLQIGGWDSATTAKPERQLGRVVIEDDSLIGTLITMSPEKVGIKFEPQLRKAITNAVSDGGTTFGDYLVDIEETYRASRKRSRKRLPIVRPDKGFAPGLRKAIAQEYDFLQTRDPVEIRWSRLSGTEFIDFDLHGRTITLNSYYRDLLVPVRGGLNDAPLIKTLVFLLTKDIFAGDRLGPTDKDNIAAWKELLRAAVFEESKMIERRGGTR